MARYTADGSLDTTFGTDGKVTADFVNEESWAHALAIDSSDKIVLAGDTFGYFTLVRYNTDGSLDTTFGTDGKVADDFGGIENEPFALAIDRTGKIVVAGVTNPDDGYGDFALARYLAEEINPPTGTIQVNGEADATRSTEVTLTLTATDNTPGNIRMCISNTMTCSTWTAFAETRSWTLATGDGTKTVNVWFRDVWGNESDVPYSDTILLDTVAPTNGTVTATPGIGQVTLEWTGFTDTDSGIGDYKVVFSRGSAPASCSEGKQIYNGPDTTYLHTGLTPGTTYYYRVCAIDEAGNISTGKTVKAKPQ